MKVGVDSVLLGAWMDLSGARRLLDAGCGSGLLALMAAQKLSHVCAAGPDPGLGIQSGLLPDFTIDAIDIDAGAVADSEANFAASPWAAHLNARRISLQDFADEAVPNSYDHIFSNPPYYDDSPSSGDAARDTARSTETLTRRDIIFAASKLLGADGRLSLILPFDQGKKMILEATCAGWSLRRQWFVKSKPAGLPIRLLLEFSTDPGRLETETLVIGDERYKTLTSPFYL